MYREAEMHTSWVEVIDHQSKVFFMCSGDCSILFTRVEGCVMQFHITSDLLQTTIQEREREIQCVAVQTGSREQEGDDDSNNLIKSEKHLRMHNM